MTPDELDLTLRALRDAAAAVDLGMTSDDLLSQATAIASGLAEDQARNAATLYLVRLLKDRHREAVAAVERAAGRRVQRERLPETPESRARHEEGLRQSEEFRVQRELLLMNSIKSCMEDYASSLRMEWTRELLDSTFSLPDGTLVAWGAATEEDHAVRRDMLLSNARGNTEAAGRHEVAIRALRDSGADCLDALPVAA